MKLWKEGSTLIQKITIVTLLVLVLWPFQVFLSHRFAPSQSVMNFAFWGALGFTLFFCFLTIYVRKTSPTTTALPYTGIKKISVLLGIFILVYVFAWINFAVSAPQLITYIFGQDRSYLGTAEKKQSSSRRSCKYRLVPGGVNFWLFHYCIPHRQYVALPDGPLDAQLTIKDSPLGAFYIEIVVLTNER